MIKPETAYVIVNKNTHEMYEGDPIFSNLDEAIDYGFYYEVDWYICTIIPFKEYIDKCKEDSYKEGYEKGSSDYIKSKHESVFYNR